MPSQGAGFVGGIVELAGGIAVRVSLMRVDLPEPDTPVTQVMSPRGFHVHALEVVAPGFLMRSRRFLSGAMRRSGDGDAARPERYGP